MLNCVVLSIDRRWNSFVAGVGTIKLHYVVVPRQLPNCAESSIIPENVDNVRVPQELQSPI